MSLNLETGQCVGCGQTFYLQDSRRTVGSPEFCTFCHNECCGKSTLCTQCSIYKRKMLKMRNIAVTQLFNVLDEAIKALNDDELVSVSDISLDLSPLIAAELDKRSELIRDYTVSVKESLPVLNIKL